MTAQIDTLQFRESFVAYMTREDQVVQQLIEQGWPEERIAAVVQQAWKARQARHVARALSRKPPTVVFNKVEGRWI
jgi:siroheme synthase